MVADAERPPRHPTKPANMTATTMILASQQNIPGSSLTARIRNHRRFRFHKPKDDRQATEEASQATEETSQTKPEETPSKPKPETEMPPQPTTSSQPYSLNSVISSIITPPTAPSSSTPSSSPSYTGVILNNTVGTLTVTFERLVFRPLDSTQKQNIVAWPLEEITKHEISDDNTGKNEKDTCLLKLILNQHPNKATIIKFPHRTALENIHTTLTNRLQQSRRKYRNLKDTLLSTQRRLKEANKTIDELQDTNEKLLEACDKLGRKARSLALELKQQNHLQHHLHRHHHKQPETTRAFVADDKALRLEKQMALLKSQMEKLQNEKIAMEIEYEMDIQEWNHRLTDLEKDLAEERAITERLLEERQPADELQLENSVLIRELSGERQLAQKLKEQLSKREKERGAGLSQQENDEGAEEALREVRRQRNNAFLELAHVKKERDGLVKHQHQMEWQENDKVGHESLTNSEQGGMMNGESKKVDGGRETYQGLIETQAGLAVPEGALHWRLPSVQPSTNYGIRDTTALWFSEGSRPIRLYLHNGVNLPPSQAVTQDKEDAWMSRMTQLYREVEESPQIILEHTGTTARNMSQSTPTTKSRNIVGVFSKPPTQTQSCEQVRGEQHLHCLPDNTPVSSMSYGSRRMRPVLWSLDPCWREGFNAKPTLWFLSQHLPQNQYQYPCSNIILPARDS